MTRAVIVGGESILRLHKCVPRVLGYQLHSRRSPRRENVIRINNSNPPSPLPTQFAYAQFHPRRFRSTNFSRWRYHSREYCVPLPCATELFPPFLACPSPRLPEDMKVQIFTNLSTRARLRCLKNSDNVERKVCRPIFHHFLANKILYFENCI